MPSPGRIKLGFLLCPSRNGTTWRALAGAPYAAVDPCVGGGTGLIESTRNTRAHLAGLELDTDRAAAAAEKGIATVHGSVFECRVLAETCSLLYLNLPYDCDFGAKKRILARSEFTKTVHPVRSLSL